MKKLPFPRTLAAVSELQPRKFELSKGQRYQVSGFIL